MKISNKDPGAGHFAVSLVKSIFRLVASAILILAGYYLYGAENYTDLLLSRCWIFFDVSRRWTFPVLKYLAL